MMNVNVIGVLNGMQAVLSRMIDRRAGTIINISSIAGRKTFGNHAAYCATKFGVHALTETVREEVSSSGIRCITVAPGVVETELLSHTTSEEIKAGYQQWKEEGLRNQPLTSEDVARSVVFVYAQPPHVCIRELVIGPTFQQA